MNLKTQWYACLGKQKANKNICRSQRYCREEFLHLLYSSLGVVEEDLVGVCKINPSSSLGVVEEDLAGVCKINPSSSLGVVEGDLVGVCKINPSSSFVRGGIFMDSPNT
jgi:hypothetical protein